MNEDSTRNGVPLSFADTLSPLERAALGLQADLSLFEIGKLTFPDNAKFQQSLVQTLISNAKAGNLPVYGNPDGWLADCCEFDTNYNRIWSSLAYPLAEKHQGTSVFPVEATNTTSGGLVKIKKWHGDNCLVSYADYFAFLKTPLALGIPEPNWLAPAAESIPPIETSLPEPARPASPTRLTESQQDKQDCQAIARELWAEHPDWIQADLLKNSRIKPYLNKWTGKNTVPGWLSDVDPRIKEQRRGRPKAR